MTAWVLMGADVCTICWSARLDDLDLVAAYGCVQDCCVREAWHRNCTQRSSGLTQALQVAHSLQSYYSSRLPWHPYLQCSAQKYHLYIRYVLLRMASAFSVILDDSQSAAHHSTDG